MQDLTTLKNKKFLYIENDEATSKNYKEVLEYFSKNVKHVKTCKEAEEELKGDYFDIIIIEVDLEDKNGLDLASQIRQDDENVIIIITSFNKRFEDLRKSIHVGALDYLIKPLDYMQLREVLERCVLIFEKDNAKVEELTENLLFDWKNKELITDMSTINLTKKEILFLELLIENRGQIISYEKISSMLYLDKEFSHIIISSIKNIVFRLKKKIKKEFIKNVPGIGYYVL